MLLGWRTNCFPLRVPSLLALVVALYSADVKDLIAFSGKYLSPVFALGLPDLVRHFCFVHDLRLRCDLANAIITFLVSAEPAIQNKQAQSNLQ
jgi:hypothetical protein